MHTTPLTLQFSPEEALVLFEWLTRVDDAESLSPTFVDESEQKVLWVLEGQLERILPAPFASDYEDLVARARAKVRDAPIERSGDK